MRLVKQFQDISMETFSNPPDQVKPRETSGGNFLDDKEIDCVGGGQASAL